MARTYNTFGDIEGKLDLLRVECTKCNRRGRYNVRKMDAAPRPLPMEHGHVTG